MEKYEMTKQLGDGTYGCVLKALNKTNNEIVAIKKMKQRYYTWDECIKLREVQSLRRLNAHPNVVRLKEVVRHNNELFFVFEYMDRGDLLGIIRQYKPQGTVPANKIRSYIFQVLQGLAYIHRSGYLHRDMKPENILLRQDGSHEIVKLADFGLAKEVRARPPFTEYVSTRWYRAPEVLLQDKAYNSPVDMWAVGCIMAELFTLRPLFPGSNESDQLFRIAGVLGSPSPTVWPEGIQLARRMRYNFPSMAGSPLQKVVPQAPLQAIDLMAKLMHWDPNQRLTASQALQHPYFRVSVEDGSAFPDAPKPRQTSTAPQGQKPQELPSYALPQKKTHAPLDVAKPASVQSERLPPVDVSRHTVAKPTQQQQQTPSVGSGHSYGNPNASNFHGQAPSQATAGAGRYGGYGAGGGANYGSSGGSSFPALGSGSGSSLTSMSGNPMPIPSPNYARGGIGAPSPYSNVPSSQSPLGGGYGSGKSALANQQVNQQPLHPLQKSPLSLLDTIKYKPGRQVVSKSPRIVNPLPSLGDRRGSGLGAGDKFGAYNAPSTYANRPPLMKPTRLQF